MLRACVVVTALSLVACGKDAAQKPACVDVTAANNSAGTTALFASRHCQGGGVTWGALFGVLVKHRGSSAPVEEPGSGWTGEVRRLNGKTTYSIDDESDAARFCSDDPALVDSIRHDYERLNGSSDALKGAMAESSDDALECAD